MPSSLDPADRCTPAVPLPSLATSAGVPPARIGPIAICLAERYEGVRIALREQLEGSGVAQVVAEAGTVAQARAATGATTTATALLTGLTFPDGTAADLLDLLDLSDLLDPALPVVVYTWLPPDEREVDLGRAAAVVGLPLVAGLIGALRDLAVAYPVSPTPDRPERSPAT